MKFISSRDNPAFKRLKLLAHSGRERRKARLSLLDGAHLLGAYAQSGGTPAAIIVTEAGAEQPQHRGLVGHWRAVPVLCLADALFAEISPVDTPSGLLAEIAIPVEKGGALAGSCLVLDAVQDAGNVGALLRVAAGAGVVDVLLTPGCAQAWSPRVLRAAMGAHFSLRVREQADVTALLANYRGRIVAASLRQGQSLYDADLSGPLAWLFGNEGAGLTPALAERAQLTVHIPMAAGIESLNVATAAAVCLFEQRRRCG